MAGITTAATHGQPVHEPHAVVIDVPTPMKDRVQVRPAKKEVSRSHARKPIHLLVRPTATHASGCTTATWRSTLTGDEVYIIEREHGLQSLSQASDYSLTHAYNPQAVSTGHAFGLGQLTDAIRNNAAVRLGVNPNSTEPCTQLALLRSYSSERYGTEDAAVEFWRSHGWW